MIAGRAAIVVPLFAATLLARSAAAQSQSLPGTLELAIGTVWSGAQSLGSRDANLSTGTGGTLRLFSSSSELGAVAGIEARVGLKVKRTVEVEGVVSYARPELRTTISGDTENGLGVTAVESVHQYQFGGSVLRYLPIHSSRRAGLMPFAFGGASYLRQLHEGAALIATGQTYHAGGGAKVL